MSGLEPSRVSDVFLRGWAQVRPDDEHVCLKSCEGEVIGYRSTGLIDFYEDTWNVVPHSLSDQVDVYIAQRELRDTKRLVRRGLIDIAATCSWSDCSKLPTGSSRFVADAVCEALRAGIDELHIHLPRFSVASDLGLGFLGAFSHRELRFDDDVDAPQLAAAIDDARAALANVRLIVTYSAEQGLLGISGMAKAWADRAVAGAQSQDFERHAGAWIHGLKSSYRAETAQASAAPLSNSGLNIGQFDVKSIANNKPFAGVGGGLGLIFDLLGAQIWPISEFALRSGSGGEFDLFTELGRCDIALYLTGVIGESIPRGLTLVSEQAQEHGVPLVLIAQSAGLRRGDLPRFGLAGAYEVVAGEDWIKSGSFDAVAKVEPNDVEMLVGRIAHTWGW
ncbi:glycerate kinase [Arcanobacterium pluranimalium]|uniref:hypothetical protein n=1 Tax=Arcanobacterium pluranimalium TaxID=108028 RepID=UPI001956AC44|nr:hypothetical protein [Arcanobacterium pluranimalium]MBM7825523.1 glycerate kinase [Arcanobacterium pluranimalium]